MCDSDLAANYEPSIEISLERNKVNAMGRVMALVKLIQLQNHVLLTELINNLCHLVLSDASCQLS